MNHRSRCGAYLRSPRWIALLNTLPYAFSRSVASTSRPAPPLRPSVKHACAIAAMMQVPSVVRTASCQGARARPTSDPSCAHSAVPMSRISEPPIPSGRKSTGAGGVPPAAWGASWSTLGTSARRLASRKAMASG